MVTPLLFQMEEASQRASSEDPLALPKEKGKERASVYDPFCPFSMERLGDLAWALIGWKGQKGKGDEPLALSEASSEFMIFFAEQQLNLLVY